jgi:hypothetical protein
MEKIETTEAKRMARDITDEAMWILLSNLNYYKDH